MKNRPGLPRRQETAYRLLKDLIRVDTTNPPGRESAAVEVLKKFFAAEGLEGTEVSREKGRSNFVLRTKGPQPGLLLAGHLDVVPARRERWTKDPFGAEEEGGYLYGRGAIDMKHFVAMSAVLLTQAAGRTGGTPRRELIFAALADEEAGCRNGSRFLVEKHPELVRAEYMLGEGGGMTQYAAGVRFIPIGRAEKGHLVVRLRFKGRPGHASMPHPDNAAFKAGDALSLMRPGALPVHVSGPARDFVKGLAAAIGFKGVPLRALGSGLTAPALLKALPRELANNLRPMLGHTVSPTLFEGSRAVNVLPDTVSVDLDIRVLPGFGAEDALGELWRALGGEIEHEIIEFTPGVVSRIDRPFYRRLEDIVAAHNPGAAAVPFLIPGFTDASFFHRLGMDCYGFAPLVLGERDAGEFKIRMHGIDERIPREGFYQGYAMLEDAVLSYLEN